MIFCEIYVWSFMTKKHLCKVRPWNQKSFVKATLLGYNSGWQSLNLHFWLISKSSALVGWLISQFPRSQQSWFKTSQDLQVSDWDWWNMMICKNMLYHASPRCVSYAALHVLLYVSSWIVADLVGGLHTEVHIVSLDQCFVVVIIYQWC